MVLSVPSFSASMIGLPHDLEPHHNLEPVVVEDDATDVQLKRLEISWQEKGETSTS